jgi:hypothetical protein
MAKGLREQTVAVADEAAAQKWDALPELAEVGHTAHAGQPDDAYQMWISANRLALSAAMEGLGSDSDRWDDAHIESALVATASTSPDAVFAATNVLKAEFLVARRLAFEGSRAGESERLVETGTYADTGPGAEFGQNVAALVLAQRATLDALDKIAVVTNLHFEVGDPADRIKFREFWTERKTNDLRGQLPRFRRWPDYALTLAELAFDLDDRGLYARAQRLRNAGTHRLIHIDSVDPTGPSRDAIVTIPRSDLVAACIQSLRVTRAAFLYLLDFIAEDSHHADS